MSFKSLATQLVEAGKVLYDWGMVPATSGNFSARVNEEEIAITVSGKHKGKMSNDDIMRINLAGESLDGKKSSAETGLHTQIYNRLPEIKACLHVHSLTSCLISKHDDKVILKDYELLKAFPGIHTHELSISIPVFDNDQDIERLASVVDSYMQDNTLSIPVYLIRGHGVYVWGDSVNQTLNYIEALDFLFKCELTERGVISP